MQLCKVAVLGKERNFTTSSVSRAAFLLALPAMLELVVESLFVIVDLLYVSRLGTNAIAISGMISSVILIIYSVPVGLNIAATSLVARRTGEKQPLQAGATAIQAIYVGMAVAVVLSTLALYGNKTLLHWIGASDTLIQEGGTYARIRFGCLLFMILRVLMNGVFRGLGDAAMAMRVLLLTFSINAVLGGILIFGLGPVPALGLTGAAIGNVVGNGIAVAYQGWYLSRQRLLWHTNASWFRPDWGIMRKMGKLGIAGTLQYLIPSSSWLLMMGIVAHLGNAALTGYIIADRIIICATLPAWGIANAAGVLTGQNIGAGLLQRAEQSVWKTGLFNVCFLGVVAIGLLLFTYPIAGFFTSDADVLQNTVLYLRCMAIAFFFFGYTMVISRSLNAAGHVHMVSLLYVGMFYVIQLPLAYLWGITWGAGSRGIFGAILVSEIALAITCIFLFKKGRWKTGKL
ncbi:multi antimicrobial extrusion protein (Na(+)/drug antiporter), MATE family of MDR efflux pumps [Filimonas lacunae]|nr:multi antimicrobial extrusion protein (Na(+)/drug antiporter), MATE family of MDR efflux pumps [Filimonas lacunae]